MPMKSPPHPGFAVKSLCLEPLGLTVTEGAKALGVSRKALSDLVNGRAGISGEMAIRLSKAFGGTVESWLRQQFQYDLSQIEQRAAKVKVKPYRRLAAAE
jgi:addiction module HigA family antidote